jgi:hypothetical protein
VRNVKAIARFLWDIVAAVLRRPWGRRTVVGVLLVLWFTGVPLIRLCYSALMLPLRSLQYSVSSDRRDAKQLSEYTGLTAGHGAIQSFFDQVGIWAVLRELRREELSLQNQAIALAIVHQESNFRFYVKNPQSTACGLYQLIAASGEAKKMPWWSCMDPLANTQAGTAFFRQVSANAPKDFPSAMRCAYLKHYYGPAHKCANDPKGIWKSIGSRVTAQGVIYLKALQKLEAQRLQQHPVMQAWAIVEPYVPLALLLFCVVIAGRVARRKHTVAV